MHEYMHWHPVNAKINAYKAPAVPHDVVPLSTISATWPKVIHGHHHVKQQRGTSSQQSQRPEDQAPSPGATSGICCCGGYAWCTGYPVATSSSPWVRHCSSVSLSFLHRLCLPPHRLHFLSFMLFSLFLHDLHFISSSTSITAAARRERIRLLLAMVSVEVARAEDVTRVDEGLDDWWTEAVVEVG